MKEKEMFLQRPLKEDPGFIQKSDIRNLPSCIQSDVMRWAATMAG